MCSIASGSYDGFLLALYQSTKAHRQEAGATVNCAASWLAALSA
jgi:hypothetical protein